jgi:hypothetical protein
MKDYRGQHGFAASSFPRTALEELKAMALLLIKGDFTSIYTLFGFCLSFLLCNF